jgi:hypothetical protein
VPENKEASKVEWDCIKNDTGANTNELKEQFKHKEQTQLTKTQ